MQAPVVRDLVLVGGGHSHVAVLKAFGMHRVPGLRVTLISRGTDSPYSGMLPGLIAGVYSESDAHIDLVPLCRFAGARFIFAEVEGLDLSAQRVLIDGRPPVAFDIASINCGSTPNVDAIEHTDGNLIRVKPIDRFLSQWHALQARVAGVDRPLRIGVVGAGAGGVELLLSMQSTLERVRSDLSFVLITADSDVLTTHTPSVRRRFRRQLASRGIELETNARVIARDARSVTLEDGRKLPLDEALFVTNAGAAKWIAGSGFAVDDEGFLLVDECLRSVSHPNVFGAGDISSMQHDPRPKSGVFAVRQGPPLARNLRNAVLGRPLRPYRPQKRFLSLIGTGRDYAIASRGRLSAEGPWLWTLKDWIDRRFMRKYSVLPRMQMQPSQTLAPELADELPTGDHADGMRCGGCGAKVGANVLQKALARLETVARDDVVVGLAEPDDAALVRVPPGKLAALSIDAFRPLVDDAFVFGQIVANHCLNDLYAVGAEGQTAMAIATLPVWPERKLVEELHQMLAGAELVFARANVALVGGHTGEGAEISLGFSVAGLVDEGKALHKRGLNDGDKLILTKPLGTGTVFAADMRAEARGRWVSRAVDEMLRSNAAASDCLRAYGAAACTDVTGFGLAVHLGEMLRGQSLAVKLNLDALPALAGAQETLSEGWVSSLHERNAAAASALVAEPGLRRHGKYPLLFDPQTAGGLLAGVSRERAQDCVTALRRLGYSDASIIGEVSASPDTPGYVSIY